MSDEFHLRVQELLERALSLDSAQRQAYLKRECGRNDLLLQEVLSLLPHYEQMRAFELERPQKTALGMPGTTTYGQIAVAVEQEPPELEPELPFALGQYRVVQVLGRGGMGVVYRAVYPTLRKEFAIKVLRKDLVSYEDRWRFAFEAHILRQVRHPGIARITHASEISTATGPQPYFVMEYIKGESLIRYAESHKLDVDARLAVFCRVCEAVEYAHWHGVIHRDLKPSNILVDTTGQPKVLDFGIARLAELQADALRNERGRFVGTPEYASPEQTRGLTEQLTPRSDVYSLGLIAHELLTGRRPRLDQGRLHLDVSRVCPTDKRGREPSNLGEFHYFLKAVLCNALAHDEAQRYATAGELGADMEALRGMIAPPRGLAALTSRLRDLICPRSQWSPSSASRPLSAVLRKRVSMALEAEDHYLQQGRPAPHSGS
jgi:serine/threonine protein kinase